MIVDLRMPHLAGERSVLTLLASSVLADVVSLRTRLREFPYRLRPHAVVAKHDDRAHLVLVDDLKAALEAIHESVMLLEPHAEALELDEDSNVKNSSIQSGNVADPRSDANYAKSALSIVPESCDDETGIDQSHSPCMRDFSSSTRRRAFAMNGITTFAPSPRPSSSKRT